MPLIYHFPTRISIALPALKFWSTFRLSKGSSHWQRSDESSGARADSYCGCRTQEFLLFWTQITLGFDCPKSTTHSLSTDIGMTVICTAVMTSSGTITLPKQSSTTCLGTAGKSNRLALVDSY